jgi:hypothetical protein
MFAPTIMSLDVHEGLRNNFAIPLPNPNPTSDAGIPDLYYMSFEEAVKHPLIRRAPTISSKP